MTDRNCSTMRCLAWLAVGVVVFPVLVAQAKPLLAPSAANSAALQRLPPASGPFSGAGQESGLDVVLHAAGAVALTIPKGWQSYETPHARDVRLVVAPQPTEKNPAGAGDGLWLVYHVLPVPETLSRNTNPSVAIRRELATQMEHLMALATNHFAKTTLTKNKMLDGWPALQHDFEVADPTDAANLRPFWKGVHCLVRTPWGLVEIHAVAPAYAYPQREAEFKAVLDSLLLREPNLPSHKAENRLADASPILGSWKAYRSRLRLYQDGEIELAYDPPRNPKFDERGQVVHLRALPVLAGSYTAQDDVLFITWRDGSLLNYRWKLKDGQLLLTDHAGKHSLLKPLYE